MPESSVIIGYSGHGLVVAEAAKLSGVNLKFYTDLEPKESNPYLLEYLGDESNPEFAHWKKDYSFILGTGSNDVRWRCALKVLERGGELKNVIHPDAGVASDFRMGVGNFIARNVAINPGSAVGDFSILNTSCVIEHECMIGSAVHCAPGSVLLGNVRVGDGTFIGANAVVKQGTRIGKNVTIGAGTVVIRDIEDGTTVVGNPGNRIR